MTEPTLPEPGAHVVPITHEVAVEVNSFSAGMQRIRVGTGEMVSRHTISLQVSTDPQTPLPPPYDVTEFGFGLKFVDAPPQIPEEDRLFNLYLPVIEFSGWMATLSTAPCDLFLSVNLPNSVIVEGLLQHRAA